ncbi:MAG: Nif3-like dinuclear metal center hexameric protein [Candidatus Magasanikbacteria bacterium]
MFVSRQKLQNFLDDYMNIDDFRDDAMVNGLNVEGTDEISKLSFTVSPSVEFFKKSAQWGADASLTHHALFEKSDIEHGLTNPLKRRVKVLIDNDINLFSYHLPLDFHEGLGNNVVILDELGAEFVGRAGEFGEFGNPFFIGSFEGGVKRSELLKKMEDVFGRELDSVLSGDNKINRIAVISGGGAEPEFVYQLEDLDIDLYLTGEIKEFVPTLIKEMNMNFVSAGHWHTETFGVKKLAELVEDKFGVETKFIPVEIQY